MKRMLAIVCLLAAVIAAGWAQQLYVVSGSVSDQHSRQPLPHASVSAGGVSTVTNEQGRFTLKLSARPAAVVASMLGYKTQALTPTDGRQLSFRLQQRLLSRNRAEAQPLHRHQRSRRRPL